MLVSAFDIADVFFGPMALLADRLRRTRIGWSQTNGAIEIVAHRVIKLFHAVHFRLEICGRARADVTRDTFDACVCGMLIGNELRLHWKMACLPAKLDRLSVL